MDERSGKQGERRGGGPVAVASVVASVTRPLMRGRQATVARLALDWPQVVGPALAAVTAPEKLAGGAAGGALTIRASGPMALELTHLAPELIGRINAHLGREAVTRLRFSAEKRAALPQRERSLRLPPPPPKEARARAAEAVASLPEGDLKSALARLGAHILARR